MIVLNAVGIDISKGKSVVVVLHPFGKVIASPFEVAHSTSEINKLVTFIKELEEETKVVLEYTSRHHEPISNSLSIAGLYVCVVNPKRIKDFGNNTLRKVKSDMMQLR